MLCQKRFFIPFLVILVLPLVLWACSQPEIPPAPAPIPAPAPAPTPASPAADGKAVYATFCAACHGPEAQGTAVAGSLPGHSAEAIRRQVRAPMGKMPAFAESQLTEAQLDSIVAFIASMPAPENHAEPLDMDDALAVHHFMTLFALKAGDTPDALHHLDHVIDMATDHEHKERAEQARALVAAGNMHDAEHEVEEMLAGKAAPEMGMSQLHVQLAFSSLSAREVDDARHHMEHFMSFASGMDKIKGEEVVKLMDMGDMHEAGHALEQMMGMKPHAD
ncbi:MAG: cytochrome c [Chloroflexi bacterium]|nr:cytochrome c [Chloroflexota bacterium]